MPDSKRKNKQGFTLVEVLVVTLIFSAMLGIMYGAQFAVNDLYQISKEKIDLRAEARVALDFMTSELKNATRTSTQNPSPNLTIPSQPNNKSTIFYLPEDKDGDTLITDSNGDIEWATDKAIHYQYVPALNRLERLEPDSGDQKILVQNVSDVQFIDASIDPSLSLYEIKIILTLIKTTFQRRDVLVTLTSIVRLRN